MKTISQAATILGLSVWGLNKKLTRLGIEPKRSKETGWRMLTAAQIKQLTTRKD